MKHIASLFGINLSKAIAAAVSGDPLTRVAADGFRSLINQHSRLRRVVRWAFRRAHGRVVFSQSSVAIATMCSLPTFPSRGPPCRSSACLGRFSRPSSCYSTSHLLSSVSEFANVSAEGLNEPDTLPLLTLSSLATLSRLQVYIKSPRPSWSTEICAVKRGTSNLNRPSRTSQSHTARTKIQPLLLDQTATVHLHGTSVGDKTMNSPLTKISSSPAGS